MRRRLARLGRWAAGVFMWAVEPLLSDPVVYGAPTEAAVAEHAEAEHAEAEHAEAGQ